MKKNLLRTCIGIAVGGSLLITSSVMSMAGGPSGYETLKTAFKNSKKIENATLGISGTVSDNGKEFLKVNSTIKGDEKSNLLSGTVTFKDEKTDKNFTFFVDKDQAVFKDDASDIYNKVKSNNDLKEKKHSKRNMNQDKSENPQLEALGEKIMDTLVGDLKKQVNLKSIGNDEKEIDINLDKNEIPSLVNLALSVKEHDKCEKNDKVHEILGINPDGCELPELTDNVQAEKIDVKVIVDKNNIIKGIDAEFDITGTDAKNKVHDQKMKISMGVTSINSTAVDTINLDGKEVKEISNKDLGCEME